MYAINGKNGIKNTEKRKKEKIIISINTVMNKSFILTSYITHIVILR